MRMTRLKRSQVNGEGKPGSVDSLKYFDVELGATQLDYPSNLLLGSSVAIAALGDFAFAAPYQEALQI